MGCGRSMLQTTGGKLRKRRDSDGCCVGPGESDSILYILASAAFFFFLKRMLLWSPNVSL